MNSLLLFGCVAAVAATVVSAGPADDVLRTVDDRLAREFISHDGLLLDYVGEIPTAEEIADLKPNAMGWWCPIENGSMFTGEWLPALMREGASRKALVEKCVRGLIKMSEVSDVPGFIARGTGTDGKSHHPCGSNDQTDPWFLGLCEYCRWPHADPALKAKALERLVSVAKALEANGWGVPCDGAFKGQNRGNLNSKAMPFWGKSRLLYSLKSLHQLTGDKHWGDVYAALKATALDEIEAGGEVDAKKFSPCFGACVWIYLSSAQALARLIEMEENPQDRARMQKGLSHYAERVAPLMKDRVKYENTVERPFKYANWRTGYAWRVQKTQKEAESVAYSGKREILGTRKDYERNGMANPLCAAAVCALSGEAKFEGEILATLRHYDYSTPNISEFFHAAIAAAALDANSEEGGIAIPPKPATSDGQIVVFENVTTGRISPQNGVCGAPDKPGTANFAAWKAAEFPYSRTHDLNLCATYGSPYVIDVPWIFRDFDADENDPKSYDFACTDDILRRIREVGVEPFYRLGGAYENYQIKKHTIFPPKDFAKWARICEHIIAHYTEGWADGYKWKMEHWEIWNEPDLRTGMDNGANGTFWRGPRDQFKELWKTALKHLKARFPHLKFGGAAFAGTGGDWGSAMVKEFAAEKVPLDFYSWHCYATDPASYGHGAKWVRQMLDAHGYTNTLSVIDEWNYVKGWDVHALGGYSRNVWLGDKNDKCAAFIAASMIELDAAGVDIGMFYDARKPGMNALFNQIDGQPMRGYYPFIAWRNLRRLGTRVKTTSEFKDDVWTVAAKGADGKLGILVARYTDDDNAFRPKRVTLRLASGKSLKNAVCHLTDRNLIYTAYDPEPNADGSIDMTMAPCSFAYVEVTP